MAVEYKAPASVSDSKASAAVSDVIKAVGESWNAKAKEAWTKAHFTSLGMATSPFSQETSLKIFEGITLERQKDFDQGWVEHPNPDAKMAYPIYKGITMTMFYNFLTGLGAAEGMQGKKPPDGQRLFTISELADAREAAAGLKSYIGKEITDTLQKDISPINNGVPAAYTLFTEIMYNMLANENIVKLVYFDYASRIPGAPLALTAYDPYLAMLVFDGCLTFGRTAVWANNGWGLGSKSTIVPPAAEGNYKDVTDWNKKFFEALKTKQAVKDSPKFITGDMIAAAMVGAGTAANTFRTKNPSAFEVKENMDEKAKDQVAAYEGFDKYIKDRILEHKRSFMKSIVFYGEDVLGRKDYIKKGTDFGEEAYADALLQKYKEFKVSIPAP